MKENKNTPDWLKNAKESIEQFEDSKYGKLSEKHINSILNGGLSQKRHDLEYQSEMGKRGGAKGAAAAEAKFREIYGDEYNDYMKSILYDNIKDKKEFHIKGGQIGGKISGKIAGKIAVESGQLKKAQKKSVQNRKIEQSKNAEKIYNMLPNGWFTIQSIDINSIKPFSIRQLSRYITQYDSTRYTVDKSCRPTKYKKTNSKKDI